MTSDHLDRDGIPLPTRPLEEPAGGEVVDLHPTGSRAAAQEKAGKTWAALDLAVSVATGRPWLDHFACPSPGPVLVFLGEGGERATARRIEAIATANGIDPTSWPTSCGSASEYPASPPSGAGSELAAIQAELAAHHAALVVLDPLYLAAAGPAAPTCKT